MDKKELVEKMWNYGALSDSERNEVEEQVRAHPEYASILSDSKALHVLFKEAGVFASDTNDEVAMAYLVGHSQVMSTGAPAVLENAFQQLKVKIETMPHALERYSEVKGRMEQIAKHNDPVVQFEKLTGYDIDADFLNMEVTPSESRREPDVKLGASRAVDRLPVGRSLLLRSTGLKTRVIALSVILVMSIGYFSNRVSRNAYTSADILLINEIVDERGLGDYESPVSPDVVFTFGQRALYESQHVWFGLYYTFDKEKLAYAEELLVQVLENEVSSPFLKEESRFLLSKAYLAQGKYEEAQRLLDELIDMRGRRVNEALALRSLL